MRPSANASDDVLTGLTGASLLAQLPVAACAVDATGRVVAWNAAAERLSGLAATAVVGAASWAEAAGVDDGNGRALEPAACPLTLALAGDRPREASLGLRRSDGERLPILVQAAPLRGGDGRLVGAVATLDEDRRRLVLMDPVTGLGNRRFLEERLEAVLAEFERLMSPSGLLLVEVDGLAALAERRGREAADAALRATARALTASARPYDVVGRWEENGFLALIREVEPAELAIVAERLRDLVAHAKVEGPAAGPPLTASFGAALTARGETPATLLGRARAALHRAKAEGGDRVVVAVPPAEAHPLPSPPDPGRLAGALERLAHDVDEAGPGASARPSAAPRPRDGGSTDARR